MRLLFCLVENAGYESYNDIWLTTTTFLEEKSRASASLPSNSSEKLLIEALIGAMHQFKPDAATDPASQIPSLVAKLNEILGDADSELAKYVQSTSEGLQRLQAQLPAGGEEEPPAAAPEADGAAPVDGGKPGEPIKPRTKDGGGDEEPESETAGMAKKLGLADSLTRRPRLFQILEQTAPFAPGAGVVYVKDGKTVRRQVVRSDAFKTSLVNPDDPNESEEIDTRELGDDTEGKPAEPSRVSV